MLSWGQAGEQHSIDEGIATQIRAVWVRAEDRLTSRYQTGPCILASPRSGPEP